MTKKSKSRIAMAVLLAIILTACAADPAPSPVPSAPPAPFAPSDEERSPVLSAGVILPTGALPDGSYTLLAPPERRYPGTMLGLEPSPDYGRIWPFIGGDLARNGWNFQILYGLCDDSGRIICDPYYDDVEMIRHGDTKFYALKKRTGKRLSEDYLFGDGALLHEITLCATGGSWAEVYDDILYKENQATEVFSYHESTPEKVIDFFLPFMWRPSVEYDYITALRGGKWGVVGWDGDVLLPFAYPEPVCFREGLACVLSEDGETVRFIDISGETVFGPFEAPPEQSPWGNEDYADRLLITKNILFHEGFARFYEGGKYGMIDRSGQVAVPALYEYITSFANGLALTISYDGYGDVLYGVVNPEGVVLAEAETDNAPFIRDGHAILDYDWETKHGVALYPDGSREEYIEPATIWQYYFEDGKVQLADGRVWDVPGAERMEPLDEGRYIVHFYGENGNGNTWQLYDETGNAISDKQLGLYLDDFLFSDDGAGYILMLDTTDWPASLLLFDQYGNPLFRKAYTKVFPFDGRFMVIDGDYAGLMDEDEHYVIKVSLRPYDAD